MSEITVIRITGIEDRAGVDGVLRIYPNPASEFLIIEPVDGSAHQGKLRVELFAVTGQKLIDTGHRDIILVF